MKEKKVYRMAFAIDEAEKILVENYIEITGAKTKSELMRMLIADFNISRFQKEKVLERIAKLEEEKKRIETEIKELTDEREIDNGTIF